MVERSRSLDVRLRNVDADLLVIKWMLGATFAAAFGVFLKSFFG